MKEYITTKVINIEGSGEIEDGERFKYNPKTGNYSIESASYRMESKKGKVYKIITEYELVMTEEEVLNLDGVAEVDTRTFPLK